MTRLTFDTLNENLLTPMLKQYLAEKNKWPDCLLFFRMGDFYELFFDDAVTASRELELTLTKREAGQAGTAPMCGVPHHAADQYIYRLTQRGYKVAVCDQVEDPATAKGLVRREVVRIVTPGTVTDPKHLDASTNSFVVAVFQQGIRYGLAACDLSSGHFETTTIPSENSHLRLKDELTRLSPHELIVNLLFAENKDDLLQESQVTLTVLEDTYFSDSNVESNRLLASHARDLWANASAALLSYIESTQLVLPKHIESIAPYEIQTYMLLDSAARLNLELTETIRERSRKGSLLATIDRTKTAMGSRLLRRWLLQPLIDKRDIETRQTMVARFHEDFVIRQTLRESLDGLFDLERLAGRIALGRVTPKDLLALADVLLLLPEIKATLESLPDEEFTSLSAMITPLDDLASWLKSALVDDPPLIVGDRQLIRDGFDPDMDALRDALTNGRQWLVDLEQKEREKTSIKNLKVGYNRVFGYYFEVSKGNVGLVPDYFVRKQTLVNAERYFTDELKTLEDKVLGAEIKVTESEREWFQEMKTRAAAHLSEIQKTAHALSMLDVYLGLAELADKSRYVRPEINEDSVISIMGGRHPVVEKQLKDQDFVPNDAVLDHETHRLMLLTGPNMAGKSTYMRQVALIVLLAQIGSFVPADSARIGLVDRIFTRVGASDDVAGGQSTFMVEMTEVANICRQATAKSLIILDEVGRGTSTFDGLAIAWAVIEYVSDPALLGARTLFATHYHELTELEGVLAGLVNYHVAVTEQDGDIVFLHRIRSGGTDDSYGVDVAKLAGVPPSIVERAREILMQLEKDNKGRKMKIRKHARPMDGQLDLFSGAESVRRADRLFADLAALDIDNLRPIDALTYLSELNREAKAMHLNSSLDLEGDIDG